MTITNGRRLGTQQNRTLSTHAIRDLKLREALKYQKDEFGGVEQTNWRFQNLGFSGMFRARLGNQFDRVVSETYLFLKIVDVSSQSDMNLELVYWIVDFFALRRCLQFNFKMN